MANYIIYTLSGLMAVFGFRRLMFCLKFMQQNGYYNKRFLRFTFQKLQLFDTRAFIPMLLATIIFPYFSYIIILPLVAVTLQTLREKNPKKSSIKPLVMTGRAKRIFWIAFTLWIVTIAYIAIGKMELRTSLFFMSGITLLAPAFLMISNFLLIPVEKINNQKFINEAKAKLKKYQPIVIGITGSFGKTSVKNILNHILSTYSSSFATKRSINTLMGIVRVIREEMNQPYKFFVAEMGIGDKGQMPELVRFINPDLGIITAVAAAHLENFKKLETVAREKFRLSQYVARKGGRTLLAAANIAPEFLEKYKATSDIVFNGEGISDIEQTTDGLSFSFVYENEKHRLFAPIYGVHQAQNVALAFITARLLGVSADAIALALKTLPQTEHRLEMRREGNSIVLDDSFNSNIKGFLSALDTGAAIKGHGRLVLITPGMVELGSLHAEQHRLAGKKANDVCDIVIAVNPTRIEDFTSQIEAKKLVKVDSLKSAREWLTANSLDGDVVIYENDLPDVYIEKISI